MTSVHEAERWDLEVLKHAVRYQQWVLSALGPRLGGDVLEVGAGNGNFTRWLAPRANRLVALEPDPALSADLGARVGPNTEVLATSLETLKGHARRFDSVIMINVLEHIADDVGALVVARELLKPDGRVYVFVPAHRWLYGSLDRRYHHVRRYTLSGLKTALADARLRVDSARYFNPIGALGWALTTRVLRRQRLSPHVVRLSERVAVPLGVRLERIGRLPFGQSVVAVAGRTPERS